MHRARAAGSVDAAEDAAVLGIKTEAEVVEAAVTVSVGEEDVAVGMEAEQERPVHFVLWVLADGAEAEVVAAVEAPVEMMGSQVVAVLAGCSVEQAVR